MAGPVAAVAGIAAAAAAALAAIYAAVPESVQRIAKEEMARMALGEVDEYENEAMKAAFATIGLDIEPSEGLTPQAITAAINAGPLAGTGIELSNLFDRDAVKRDLEKLALRYAAQAFGIELTSLRPEAIKEAVKGELRKKMLTQLSEGAGEWLELAPDLVHIARSLDEARRTGRMDAVGNFVPPELAMDDYHVKLRERQARYRANHTRHWEER